MGKKKNKDVKRNSGDLFTIRLERDGVKYWLITARNNECDPVADCGDCFFNWIPPSGIPKKGVAFEQKKRRKERGPVIPSETGI